MAIPQPADAVHAMVASEDMCASGRKLRDFYARVPGAPLFHREFGYYCRDRWYAEGLAEDADFDEMFGYDPPGHLQLRGVGWTYPAYEPAFEEKIIEDRGAYEVK